MYIRSYTTLYMYICTSIYICLLIQLVRIQYHLIYKSIPILYNIIVARELYGIAYNTLRLTIT